MNLQLENPQQAQCQVQGKSISFKHRGRSSAWLCTPCVSFVVLILHFRPGFCFHLEAQHHQVWDCCYSGETGHKFPIYLKREGKKIKNKSQHLYKKKCLQKTVTFAIFFWTHWRTQFVKGFGGWKILSIADQSVVMPGLNVYIYIHTHICTYTHTCTYVSIPAITSFWWKWLSPATSSPTEINTCEHYENRSSLISGIQHVHVVIQAANHNTLWPWAKSQYCCHSIFSVIPRQADTTQFPFPPAPLSSPILVSKHKILPHDTSKMPELHWAGETEEILPSHQTHPLGQFSALLPS